MASLLPNMAYSRAFLMVQAVNHLSPATGATVAVNLSKAGGLFSPAAGIVSEIGQGWYNVALTTDDTNTFGDLAFNCTAAGCDPTDFRDQVLTPDLNAGELPRSGPYVRAFLMTLALDHISPAPGKTVLVGISKRGGIFAPPAGNVFEIGNGWYAVSLTVADTNLPGDLSFTCLAAGCDNTDFVDQVSTVSPKSATQYCLAQGQEVRFLRQHAILWPFLRYDKYGQPLVDYPVEVCVRWLTKRREVLDHEGNTIALDAEAVVNRRINEGSWMWLGTLEDWYSGVYGGTPYAVGTAPAAPAYGMGSASFDNELHEVKSYNETPDVKARHVFRKVGLIRIPNAHAATMQLPFPGLTGIFNMGVHP